MSSTCASATQVRPDAVASRGLGVVRATALFVATIIGPGVLTLPALAAAEAGPASLLALALLLVASAPIAATFVALDSAVPHAHGVAGYAAAAFGGRAADLVAAWFRYGVPVGVPALGLIGGEHVAAALGAGEGVTVAVAAVLCAVAVGANLLSPPGHGPLTLVVSGLLLALVLTTAVLALPHARRDHLTPFAPHGYLAVAGSALVLTWVLTGWEAVTNFNGVVERRDLPRITAATLAVVAVVYAAVAVPLVLVLGPRAGASGAPVAALLEVAVGPAGIVVAAVVAVTIATGTTVAWVGSLAEQGLARRRDPGGVGPRARARALAVPVLIGVASLALVALTPVGTETLVSVCAGAQVPVYLLGVAAGLRVFRVGSRAWWLAVLSTAAVALLLVAAGSYLLVPTVIAVAVVLRPPSHHASSVHVAARRRVTDDAQAGISRPRPRFPPHE